MGSLGVERPGNDACGELGRARTHDVLGALGDAGRGHVGQNRVPPDDLCLFDRLGRTNLVFRPHHGVRGHLAADLDPLRLKAPESHPELEPATYGFTEAKMAWAECPFPVDETPSGYHLYPDQGILEVIDPKTGLPLPMGGNAIRRELGPKVTASVAKALKQSIEYALEHREEALQYALQFARDLDPELADKFVGMYVNQRTVEYGEDGRRAEQDPEPDHRGRAAPGWPASAAMRLACVTSASASRIRWRRGHSI